MRKFLLVFCLTLTACVTHKPNRPVGIIPEQRSVTQADEEYGQNVLSDILNHSQLERDDAKVLRVRKIVESLTKKTSLAKNPWNVYVLKNDHLKNAGATRGNFIFVWTGLLNTLKDDNELASVLAHEISHLLLEHYDLTPAEEASKILGQITESLLNGPQSKASLIAALSSLLIDLSIEALFLSPQKRDAEFEADLLGLFLMADAKYDPQHAIKLWQRLEYDPDFNSALPEFLSSHPSSKSRLDQLKNYLNQAYKRYLIATSDVRDNR